MRYWAYKARRDRVRGNGAIANGGGDEVRIGIMVRVGGECSAEDRSTLGFSLQYNGVSVYVFVPVSAVHGCRHSYQKELGFSQRVEKIYWVWDMSTHTCIGILLTNGYWWILLTSKKSFPFLLSFTSFFP